MGDSLGDSKIEIKVNLKPDKYTEIGSLKDLSQADREAVAATISGSFQESDGYEWYETDSADYFVFDTVIMAHNETRYATIVNGCMVYIFVSSSEGKVDESLRLELQNIVDTVGFYF